ncbi:dihydrofolate reductase [Candidatus Roizmanbacteria bacterium CG10_big_fil_rev_8_21_14_0_10_39_6]|uniref:Dihydrofolate reductase n=1 Tax=Candidatus Roizmanbacteria bacterium CG10_big_fil_rev_8_21_14_0_10_39_6 TaxID=1974853 RepID=A0A2M8KRT6_9BACT|nr:MAG: dihydrofolate reductase [Candidatus Roizmanbacteria bacterium CG10_big_fil_rev_8_21_14_0_10_39_6]
MKPTISIVAAIGKNKELGKNNQLIWRISSDLKRFKEITMGHPIIMGRKTYESIGKPLPGRENIVITRNTEYKPAGVTVVHSLHDALKIASKDEKKEIFIIGGAALFKESMTIVDRLYLTIVDATANADVYFPDYSQYSKVIKTEEGKDSSVSFTYYILEK